MKRIEKFSQEHILGFSLAVTFIALLLWQIEWDGDPFMGFDMILSHALTFILALWLMKEMVILRAAGLQKKGFYKGLLLGSPLVLLGIISTIYSNWGIDYAQMGLASGKRILLFTASMLMVGVAEEIVFRGLILNNMIKKWGKSGQGVIKAMIVSSLFFGGMHLLNLFVAPFISVVVQVINAACAGLFFSIVYIRCRNIWAAIVVHALVDWFALFFDQCFTGATSIVTNDITILQGLLIVFVGSIVPLVFSMYYYEKI